MVHEALGLFLGFDGEVYIQVIPGRKVDFEIQDSVDIIYSVWVRKYSTDLQLQWHAQSRKYGTYVVHVSKYSVLLSNSNSGSWPGIGLNYTGTSLEHPAKS